MCASLFAYAGDENLIFSFDASENPVLKLDALPLFSGMEFYFADKSWFGDKKVKMHLANAKIVRDGSSSSLVVSKKMDAALGYDLKISWTARRFDMELSYEIPKDSAYIYGVVDLFLDKGLFPSKGRFSEGTDSLGVRLDENTLVFANDLGVFKFTLKSSDDKIAPWTVRDSSRQKSRPAELQTTDLLNCTRHENSEVSGVSRQSISMALEYLPSEKAGAFLKARTSLLLIKKLKEKTIPQNDAVRLGDLERSLYALIADGRADSIESLSSEANAMARRLSAECSSYAGNGVILPAPQSFVTNSGRFKLDAKTSIVIASEASTEVASCASIFASEIQRSFGLKLPVSSGNDDCGGKVIRLALDSGAIPGKTEAYLMNVTEDGVEIRGVDARGLFYGTQSLLQMLEKDGELRISAKCGTIRDWPDISFRGMMIEMGGQDSFDWISRSIEMLAKHKYNVVVFGQTGDYNVKWDSHPELGAGCALTAKQLRAFAAKSREFFLEPVPLIQSVGHNTSVLKAHPELADSTDPKNLGNALCLANPATRKLLADLFDECVDIYKSKYFHIGGDEACPIGNNPLCKGKTPSELFTEHVKWCSDYLKSKGVKDVILWHDMLLDKRAWPSGVPAHSAASSGVFSAVVHPAVQSLPKDLIVNYWNYSETGRIPAIPYFQQFGYRVLCSGWYDDRNSYDLSAAAFDYKALGILDTSWAYCSSRNQISLVSVENAWAVNKTPFERIPYDSSKRLQAAMLPSLVSNYDGSDSKPLDIDGNCDIALDDFISYNATAHGSLLAPEGCQRLGDVNFNIIPQVPMSRTAHGLASSEKVKNVVAVACDGAKVGMPKNVAGIKVGRKVKALAFLHACASVNLPQKNAVANYVVRYKDGGTCLVPVVKGVNVAAMRVPFVHNYKKKGVGSVAEAKRIWMMTANGDELNFQVFEWTNPAPEREIDFFDVAIDSKAGTDIFALIAASAIE